MSEYIDKRLVTSTLHLLGCKRVNFATWSIRPIVPSHVLKLTPLVYVHSETVYFNGNVYNSTNLQELFTNIKEYIQNL